MYIRQKISLALLAFLFVGILTSPAALAQDGGPSLEEVSAESGIPADAGMITQGQELFEDNCYSCHRIHTDWTGPALKNVWERWDELGTLKQWIKNNGAVLASGNAYANKLYSDWNQSVMTSFSWMEDAQVDALLAYIQSETVKGPEKAPDISVDGESANAGGVPSQYINLILVGLLIVLVLILAVLVLIVTVLRRYIMVRKEDMDEADEAIVNEKVDLGAMARSPQFLFIVVFIFAAIVAKSGIDGLYSIGVQQGYQPKQPIAFSHALHAGEYEIECQYCHTGVMESKSANIPSANICMNCHYNVATTSPEIQKIYRAIDWDPVTNTPGPNQKPIEWVRIHNLPDLSYFNHSQHVNVGGQECQTCHGPIETMEVVYQYSRLTMGWCIECHRQTEINTDNAYYDKLVKLHESEDPMVVEDIGGLECSKCHY